MHSIDFSGMVSMVPHVSFAKCKQSCEARVISIDSEMKLLLKSLTIEMLHACVSNRRIQRGIITRSSRTVAPS